MTLETIQLDNLVPLEEAVLAKNLCDYLRAALPEQPITAKDAIIFEALKIVNVEIESHDSPEPLIISKEHWKDIQSRAIRTARDSHGEVDMPQGLELIKLKRALHQEIYKPAARVHKRDVESGRITASGIAPILEVSAFQLLSEITKRALSEREKHPTVYNKPPTEKDVYPVTKHSVYSNALFMTADFVLNCMKEGMPEAASKEIPINETNLNDAATTALKEATEKLNFPLKDAEEIRAHLKEFLGIIGEIFAAAKQPNLTLAADSKRTTEKISDHSFDISL